MENDNCPGCLKDSNLDPDDSRWPLNATTTNTVKTYVESQYCSESEKESYKRRLQEHQDYVLAKTLQFS